MEADALRRIRDFHPDYSDSSERELSGTEVTVRDAQLVIAKEHGFPNWIRFKAEIERREFLPTIFKAIKSMRSSRREDSISSS